MNPDWDSLLIAYLHDPPSKALDIRGHESHAAPLASIALGEQVQRSTLHADTRTEDTLASRLERIVPLPTPGPDYQRAVGPENGRLHIRHPLSGHPVEIEVSALNRQLEQDTLRELVADLDPPRARALLIWRQWRDQLVQKHPVWGLLPADTRLPDHTIWHHNDAAMGIAACKDQRGLALLTFSLGPVQSFIAAARTVRDLWTGSYLLAWLTFAAMRPVIEQCGPAAILSPSLRGNPLMDNWLRRLRFSESPGEPPLLRERIPQTSTQQLLAPCLPNRFTAFVPLGQDDQTARQLADKCEQSCRQEWRRIAEAVRQVLDNRLRRANVPHADGWDRYWHAQIESFFEVRTAVLPFNDCTDETLGRLLSPNGELRAALPDAFAVRNLQDALPAEDRPGYPQDSAGLWMAAMDLLGRLMAAQRGVRALPEYRPEASAGCWPGKCSLLGTYEQVGPAERNQADRFWQDFRSAGQIEGARIGRRDRLCAVSLVKRYAWSAYLAEQLGLARDDLRYPDTATVAARLWLQENGINPDRFNNWSGQWLHWTQPNPQDEDDDAIPPGLWEQIRAARRKQAPPAYLAILMLDGDRMGQWLRGQHSPRVRDSLAPRLTDYFARLPRAQAGLDARRPFGPALQSALTEALTNYALHVVPRVVADCQGTLIYAGGDDVLALLPTTKALECAARLEAAYRQDWDKETGRLLMGQKATVSAGLAVVHYKEDLRLALQAAREAEKAAKSAGRNALTLRIVRRSGEDSQCVIGWPDVPLVQKLVGKFLAGASDRWAYRLRAELPTLEGLAEGPFRSELSRLLQRSEQSSPQFVEQVLALWDRYHQFCGERAGAELPARGHFVTLCQSASFLARGRDNR
jgi:CRISPR-associated protein Cmr2